VHHDKLNRPITYLVQLITDRKLHWIVDIEKGIYRMYVMLVLKFALRSSCLWLLGSQSLWNKEKRTETFLSFLYDLPFLESLLLLRSMDFLSDSHVIDYFILCMFLQFSLSLVQWFSYSIKKRICFCQFEMYLYIPNVLCYEAAPSLAWLLNAPFTQTF